MKSTTLILSLAVIAAGAASSMAHSEDQQDHNLAIGFMLGKSTSNYDSGSYSGTPEGKDKSGGLFVEYDFSKHFGVQDSQHTGRFPSDPGSRIRQKLFHRRNSLRAGRVMFLQLQESIRNRALLGRGQIGNQLVFTLVLCQNGRSQRNQRQH